MEQIKQEAKGELWELVKAEVEHANTIPVSSEERKEAINRVIDLYRLIGSQEINEREERTFNADLELKKAQFDADLELRKKQLFVEKAKLGVQVGTFVASMIFSGNWLLKSMKYELNASFTSVASKTSLKMLENFARKLNI